MKYEQIHPGATVGQVRKKASAFHVKLGFSKTDWHTHQQGQLLYAEGGVMKLLTREHTYHIPSRHAAWIPAGIEHLVFTDSPGLVLRTLYFYQEAPRPSFFEGLSVFFVTSLLREMILFTEKWPAEKPTDEQEAAFFRAIELILPEQAGQQVRLRLPLPKHPVMVRVTEYISKHYEAKIACSELAALFNVSERTLSRLFNQQLGMPFSQYLKLMRIIASLELLLQPSAHVSEVAFRVGYESLPTFSNNFTELMGRRPQYYLRHQ
ncbi:MAG: helix-turn-helix transcriptional regulator [Cytophagales bacterium]|nr:helix-turn-helix transcriptional regulator [Cytophagales bacterium]